MSPRDLEILHQEAFDDDGPVQVDLRLADPPEGEPVRVWRAQGEMILVLVLPEESSPSEAVLQYMVGKTERLHLLARTSIRIASAQGLLAEALRHSLQVDGPATMKAIESAIWSDLARKLKIYPPPGGTE